MITKFTKDGKEVGDLQAFKAELNGFVIKSAKAHLKFQVDAANQLRNFLILGTDNGPGTPVDTRWAANNWWFAVGPTAPTEPIGTYPGLHKKGKFKGSFDNPQLSPTAPPTGVFANAKPYQMIWVYNNVPYIERLDEGHSTQAPKGFSANAIEGLKEWLENHPFKVE